ncbi:hypothetical protein PtA15_9A380 [Puccinia triticina]|uniref:methenyltetrahydrofolate cyclohydrolase n=1 Tax=Puccinia triticina TaxID=208348 RepID=A0ABY7CSK5_9BASI|nr:uncharacterized protein PtA15_9A380 [Puccinia triticina]WAQ88253.1 hypothetical protein PtA15_9A380 [Puccinia triticina]
MLWWQDLNSTCGGDRTHINQAGQRIHIRTRDCVPETARTDHQRRRRRRGSIVQGSDEGARTSPRGYGRTMLAYGVVAGEGTETCTAGAGSLLLEFATLLRLVGVPIYEVRPTRDRLAQAGGQYNLIDCTPSFKRDVKHMLAFDLVKSDGSRAQSTPITAKGTLSPQPLTLPKISRIMGSIHAHHRQGYLITPTTNLAKEIIRKYLKHNPDQARKWLLVQLPLKASIGQEGERRLTEAVSPQKDVNGFHAYNLGLLSSRGSEPLFNPCTPAGVIRLIDSTGFQLSCKHAVVLGRSDIVGTPVCSLLRCKNATVTQCHSITPTPLGEGKSTNAIGLVQALFCNRTTAFPGPNIQNQRWRGWQWIQSVKKTDTV